jgi:serine/threonine-protein kinase
MIGKILSNRYELIEEIGVGGMAKVYKGKDILLNRTVAVKILREQYASDSNFVRHFRKEAQAVASLSHPNIVSMYDVGEDKGIHYLVMEYIEGSNLKNVIKEKGFLDIKKSLKIITQICDALEHAHSNKVVHRDIKPHNILITPKGQVKVTDFGIARAVTEATVTYTGSMVGSVHYISPEQARGKITDYKSDIYSAGIVLYEMLTGKVPFSGDSPIAIALKHIQENVPSIKKLNPNIPDNLIYIIEKSLNKNPEERFNSASEMKDFLIDVFHETNNIVDVKGEKDNNLNKKRKLKPLGWILIFGIIIGLFYGAYLGVMGYLFVEEVKVPDVTEKSLNTAQELLQGKGLKFEIVDKRHHSLIEKNHIIKQEPKANETIKKNRTVKLELSLGPELKKVPDVKGITLRSAKIKIINSNFLVYPTIKEVYDSEVANDRVISQEPGADELQPEGTEIKLVVSKGAKPEYIEMPSLIDLPLAQAQAKLKEVGLNLGLVSYQSSSKYFTGEVISQDVSANEKILQDSTINLVVSRGPGPSPQSANVKIKIGDDGEEHLVRIVVDDEKGIHQEYLREHAPGDVINTSIPFYGQGIIKVYQDDKIIHKKNVS